MSPGTVSPLANIKAIVCDVLGTVVDWRSSVHEELTLRAFRKRSSDLPASVSERLEHMTDEDWHRFAQEWRNTYIHFTLSFDSSRDAWKNVDDHHRDSLGELLQAWGLGGLFSDAEIDSLSLVWHRLAPWPDASGGLLDISKTLHTATLSNGNTALLQDLDDFGNLGFQFIFSAEHFGAYKPDPATYLGAVRELGLDPGQVAMVAAHLNDLQSARSHGLKTVYIERPREEAWSPDEDRHKDAKQWVDMWISEADGGFQGLAHKVAELA